MDEPFSVAANANADGGPGGMAAPFPPRLGRYELLRRIATGGMAEIFLARYQEPSGDEASPVDAEARGAGATPRSEHICVIKRMLPALASQPDFVAMFVDEARLAAAMSHPNIVRTFDAGRDGDDRFMALEYLHGEDLRTLFRALRAQNRRMPLDQVAHVVSRVCAGLQHAHDRLGSDGNPLHVVHRDVSPQNVVCTFDGEVKLLDFGIAKAQGRFGETRYGTLKGKIGYMSPEQCRGEPLDRRSDVFTVAILLYELSTGRRLFRGASEYEVLRRIVEDEVPSPRQIVLAHGDGGDYPEELERIVLRGLARDPARRYPSAAALADELDDFARRAELRTSAADLARFLESVFVRKAEAWREAQRRGTPLAEHVIDQPAEPEVYEAGEWRDEAEVVKEGSGQSGIPARVNDTPSARPRSASAPHRVLKVAGEGSGPNAARATPGAGTSIGGSGSAPARDGASPRRTASPPPLPPGSAGDGRPSVVPADGAAPAPVRTPSVRLLAGTALFVAGLVAGLLLVRARSHDIAAAAAIAPVSGPASLLVVTDPPGGTVTLDGRPAPAGDEARFDGLSGGSTHQVVAEREGYHAAVRRVTLPAAGPLRLTLALQPVAAPPLPTAGADGAP